MKRFSWIGVLFVVVFSPSLYAGVEGFGSSTPAGDNGLLVKITSLDDSGPGTLREALSSGNNRRIVFTVGGAIRLQSRLVIRGRSFITVDGSTAPPPGITLAGHGLHIRNSHDIIVTHIRVRDPVANGILVWDGSYNVVIDHCSVTNAGDENINITEDTRNVTVSWCIIGDTRPDSFALHTRGMLIASFKKGAVTNVSLHHNLFINRFQRSPQISTAGLFDIRNNVIRDWGAYGIRIRNGARGNIINNVFSTSNNPHRAIVLEPNAGNVYVHGNQSPNNTDVNVLRTNANEFAVAPVTTNTINDLEDSVLKGAGAVPRDPIDTLLTGTSKTPLPEVALDDPIPEHRPDNLDADGDQDNRTP